MNLIPSQPGLTPNYWCTWCTQGAFRNKAALENPTDLKFQGDQGAKYVRESLREDVVFGPTGWLTTFTPKPAPISTPSWTTAGMLTLEYTPTPSDGSSGRANCRRNDFLPLQESRVMVSKHSTMQ